MQCKRLKRLANSASSLPGVPIVTMRERRRLHLHECQNWRITALVTAAQQDECGLRMRTSSPPGGLPTCGRVCWLGELGAPNSWRLSMQAQVQSSTMRVDAGSGRTWERILKLRDCRYRISGVTISSLRVTDPAAPSGRCRVRPLTRGPRHKGSHDDHEQPHE